MMRSRPTPAFACLCALLLSACATQSDVAVVTTDRPALGMYVTQFGAAREARYVFCGEASCASRTRKTAFTQADASTGGHDTPGARPAGTPAMPERN